MARIYGQARLTPDAKGRIVLPAKFCPPFAPGQQVFLSRHQDHDGCLALYGEEAFQKVEARMEAQMYGDDEDGRFAARLWASVVEPVKLDAQRRVPIPQHLRDHARIGSGMVLVIGSLDHLEIWDESTFQTAVEERVDAHKREESQLARARKAVERASLGITEP